MALGSKVDDGVGFVMFEDEFHAGRTGDVGHPEAVPGGIGILHIVLARAVVEAIHIDDKHMRERTMIPVDEVGANESATSGDEECLRDEHGLLWIWKVGLRPQTSHRLV